jgi:hypothetical protein
MKWQVPCMWQGGDVWIIGGGPSINEQFGIPKELAQKIKEGVEPLSKLSPYMSVIHDKHVIGINVAFMIGNWIDICFFGDNGFYLKYKNELAKFPGLKVTCNQQPGRDGFVKCMARDVSHSKGISMEPGKVSWNFNSGCAAISIAAQAGAKRIMLLGFDMKLSDEKDQHFHDVYKRGKAITEQRLRRLPFRRHMRGCEQIARDAKRLGIEIVNLNPDSAIVQFRKVSLKEFLENERS